ncbi:alpha-glucoside transport system substrate-binding protein [Devosia enhydra]|uniref:Alpha-glucoside transport system substrate-binding protein n=1 Tax=Devosia enhydra TaxID=665118 RepID=A0A1K2I0L7_9HYPH|nr:extracellular solute-binding protein [Devosia enhydra]SFZ85930.1 alpha-glucoside transport system substrate-binding protein [Devosia enhydra]
MSTSLNRRWLLIGAAAAALLAGGAHAQDKPLDPALYEKAVAKVKEIVGDAKLDPTLEYIGGNSGSEGAIKQSLHQAFTDATGTVVNYTGTGSSAATAAAVQARLQAGNPPAIADLTLGTARGLAADGHTLDLSEAVGPEELANYSATLIDSLTYDGKVYGITLGFSTFMIWYNPETYTGPNPPQSWADVVKWTEEVAATGATPWCMALEAGAGTGFPGTQWVQILFSKMHGPELLAQWSAGELPWTSPEVKSAWEAFGAIATVDANIYGGARGALSSSISTGYNGLIADPPTCQAAMWGSWVPGLIGEGIEEGVNIDFFQTPSDNPEFANTEIFNTGATVVLQDNPTSRAFIKFLASAEAQTLLASANHWAVGNTAVPPETYSGAMLQKVAATYFRDGVDLVAPPDIMSIPAVGAAFNRGIGRYLQDPSSLDQILADIQSAAEGE